jgi:hypothetical protein
MRRRELIVDAGVAAILWPCTVRAQQKTLPVIGFLSARSPEDSSAQVAGFRQGLADTIGPSAAGTGGSRRDPGRLALVETGLTGALSGAASGVHTIARRRPPTGLGPRRTAKHPQKF